jgi:hypothetical protein
MLGSTTDEQIIHVCTGSIPLSICIYIHTHTHTHIRYALCLLQPTNAQLILKKYMSREYLFV